MGHNDAMLVVDVVHGRANLWQEEGSNITKDSENGIKCWVDYSFFDPAVWLVCPSLPVAASQKNSENEINVVWFGNQGKSHYAVNKRSCFILGFPTLCSGGKW